LASITVAFGVGHPVQPLSDVRRTDARRAQIRRPPGVTRTFQVSAYSVPPPEGIRACNLLAHNSCRAQCGDDAEEVGPEVAVVVESVAFACAAEGLTGARAGDDSHVVSDARQTNSTRPAADSCKKVVLGVSKKLSWVDIDDAPFVHVAGRDLAGLDEFAQPCCGVRVEFVVVGKAQEITPAPRPNAEPIISRTPAKLNR
jgi:hypothetical protein